MTDDFILKLQGELLATQIALRSMLISHSERDALCKFLNCELDRWANEGLYSSAPEEISLGFARARKRIFPSDEDFARFP